MRVRHVVGNKLTLPLIVLRDLQEGKPITPTLIQHAIRDFAAIERVVNKETGKEAGEIFQRQKHSLGV